MTPRSYRRREKQRGFTLLEIVVVLGIMAVLIAMAGFFWGGPPTVNMKAGVSDAAAMFNQARAVAQSRQTEARVLIHHDPDEPEKFGRFMVVAYYQPPDRNKLNGIESFGTWQPAGNGRYLPNGVYHFPTRERVMFWNQLSRVEDSRFGKPWKSYSFRRSGNGEGGAFLLAAGRPPLDAETLIPEGAKTDGFLVRKNGYLTFFDHPDEIDQWFKEDRNRLIENGGDK